VTTPRVAVITGVGRAGQVGEALARHALAQGARVALLDRDAAQLAERTSELSAFGEVLGIPTDLTDVTAVQRAATQVASTWPGGVHALVCAAGGFAMSGPVAEADVEVLQRQLAISLVTAYATSRAFLPLVREAKGGVVYFASAAVLPGGAVANMSAYAAAKAGVLALMHAVADEEAPHGVRANAVAPTAVRTAANVAAMGADGMRYVEREEVAETVWWLATAATAVTGQVVRLG
jgi:NAD(P)-dependent dehydrogenase (short-subunit alcohol dehydrogenase family)